MTPQMIQEKVIRALIIEDCQSDAMILQRCLTQCQGEAVETEHVLDLQQALEVLAARQFDIIFLDNNLGGGITAKDVLDSFNEQDINVPVIIVTGQSDQQLAIDLMKAGAYDYITKGHLIQGLLEITILNTIEQHALKEKIWNLAKFPSEDPNPVLRISADGKIIYANNAGSPILNAWKCKENDYLLPPQCKLVKEVLNRGKPATFDLDCQDQIFSMTMAPVEKSGYVNVYGLDITELRISKQDMEEAKKRATTKSQFVSMVSHELRTPLTSIKGGISILLSETVGKINNKQKELLDITKRSIDRLSRLINDVLDFQKLETGKTEFNPQRNDINEVVEEIKKTMLPLANKMGLKLITKLDRTLPTLNFDRDKIIQVLTNLVDNAAKFTDNGSITITTAKDDDIIRVSVRDTGIGIKQEDLPKLFNEFEQLSNINDRKTGGTGLGLAISRRIIEQHKGEIRAESEFGKWTTISFVLPGRERGNRQQ